MDEGLEVSTLIELLETFERAYGSRSKVYLQTCKTKKMTPVTSVALMPESEDKDEPRNLRIK